MYMTQGLHRSAQQRPNAVAVRFQDKTLTFAQLHDRVARLAGALRELGVKDGERVAMLSINSARYLEYDMAVPWAGGVLNPVNIRWSHAEMLYALNDSASLILIVDDTFKAAGEKLADEARTVRHLIYAGDAETPAGMLDFEQLIADANPIEDAWRHGDDLAGIFYTGGTTGFPKGVMLSHSNLGISALTQLTTGRCGADAVYLHAMPMFHLANFAAVNALFLSGGTHVVVPAFTAPTTLEAISCHRVSQLTLAPTMLQMLIDWIDQHPEERSRLDTSSLTRIGYGASPISQTLLRRAQQAFSGVDFTQSYGMTELSPLATMLGSEYHTEEAFISGKMRAAGKPFLCVEVKIVDESDKEVPRGTVGEIAVRGGNVMLGYWNQPEATAEAVRNGWMHTGDGGYMDEEGLVYVVDRIKDMIVSGGENIYSAEVENAIASHPAVGQCAVIGVPSERWGESVHAVIVPKPGTSATAEEIQAHCRERIAGYKCPRSVEFREALPHSSVGKILKNDLRKPYWEQHGRGVA
ncbi:long-chain-fatty-acid--CoA ligase [Cupriavidus sp. YAF13]|uniref:long-chain-fatty-acid--CoA ligase n=1 Tax=Cupriavidus sp. YAF13 TaxID=3233075 RepID=UPI003F9039F8